MISIWNQRARQFDRLTVAALLPFALTFALTFALGCQSLQDTMPHGSASHQANHESLHRILKSGELRVGITGTQPPLNMKNHNGELIGLDVELASALASAMDLELILVETPFANLLNRLEAGEVDLVISSLTITPARNARVAFAGPYLISGSSLLIKEELVDQLHDLPSLNNPERAWAALEGSTGDELIHEAFPLARFVAIEDQEVAVAALGRGEFDGLVADLPFVRYQVARNPDLDLATLPSPFTTEPLGIALPPHSPLFANLVQNYLNTLDATGQLIQMKARWLNAGDWLLEVP